MIQRPATFALLALLAAGLIAGCSGRSARRNTARAPRTAEDSLFWWRWRADSMEGVLGTMDTINGQLAQSVGTEVYAAWFDSGEVRVVHEEMSFGPRGARSNRYYFERRVPRLAVETGMVPADATLRLVPLERTMLFDDLGRLVAATMSLDSVKTWVAGPEASAALVHAGRMGVIAQEARGCRGGATRPERGRPAEK